VPERHLFDSKYKTQRMSVNEPFAQRDVTATMVMRNEKLLYCVCNDDVEMIA